MTGVAQRPAPAGEAGETWGACLAGLDGGLVFHSRAWLALIGRCYGLAPFHLTAAAPDGNALLPLFLAGGPVTGRRLVSQPFNFYGGLLSNSAEATARLLDLADGIRRHERARFLEIRSAGALPGEIVREFRLAVRSPLVRHVVPLDTDPEAFERRLRPRFREKLRRLRRQAVETGIVIETASQPSRAAMRGFHDLLTDEYRQKHSTLVQPFRLFDRLAEAMGPSFRLVSARRDGRMIGAAVILSFGRTDHYLWGAYDLSAGALSPLALVLDAAMGQARAAGREAMDLGVTSRAQTGLNFFKSRWGGECQPLNYYYMAEREADIPNRDYYTTHTAVRRLIRLAPRRVVQAASALVVGPWLA